MRYQHTRTAAIFTIILLLGWVGISQGVMQGTIAATKSTQGASGVSATVSPQTAHLPSPLVGSPAIHPQYSQTDPTTPAYTAADVIQYVGSHPMPHSISAGLHPVVVSVRFLTSNQISAMLGGESTGLPDDTLLCYVELRGTFVFPGPQSTTVTYARGFEVFDAHSGNILMGGGLP